jgi:outer membrane protein assembly factor BamD (BamD/ComL family)
MRRVLAAALLLVTLACAEGARQMYDSAQFEEKQRNYEHAAQIYEQMIEKYPASEFTPKAKERLDHIRGGS